MEARIARMESDISHVRSDVGEIKVDLRSLRDKVDDVDTRLSSRINSVKDTIANAKLWALMLYISLAALNFSALARGFGWI